MNLAADLTPESTNGTLNGPNGPMSDQSDQPAFEAEAGTEAVPTMFRLQWAVSLETILYLLLFMAALVLRLPNLDTLPLDNREAHEALAVFRVLQPGQIPPAPATNPLMFSANLITMAVGSANTSTARLPTLLVSLGVVLMPLLFRRWLGRPYALIASGLLAFSPVLLISARTMEGAVWSVALALLGAWCVGNYFETRREGFALGATVAGLLLAVGAEPAGFLMLAGLVIGGLFALATMDDPDNRLRALATEMLSGWPWRRALLFVVAALIGVGTIFLFYPAGLESIGEALGTGLRGIFARPEGYPFALPLYLSVIYEPVLWIFGLAGAFSILTQEAGSPARQFIGRALLGWLIASVAFSLVYAGAQPGHTLWLTAPLVGLAAFAIERAISPVRDPFWQVPTWGPWLHGLLFLGILFIAGINLIWVGRSILSLGPAIFPPFAQQELMKVFMVALATLLGIITFFLIGSIWGSRAAWHGIGIGLLAFGLIYSLNAGWQGAVTHADDPREPWRINPVTSNLNITLRTIRTASLRATGRPDRAQIVVPDNVPDTVAWLLRDFAEIEYVNAFSSAITAPIVITPELAEPPQLGAGYVGEGFRTYSTWDRGSMPYWDFVPWLMARETRYGPVSGGAMVLWVRADVYGVMQADKE